MDLLGCPGETRETCWLGHEFGWFWDVSKKGAKREETNAEKDWDSGSLSMSGPRRKIRMGALMRERVRNSDPVCVRFESKKWHGSPLPPITIGRLLDVLRAWPQILRGLWIFRSFSKNASKDGGK